MAELKTKPGDASVESFLEAIQDEGRRRECRTILAMMKKATGCAPKMWGKDMVGFDAVFARAIAAGAQALRPAKDSSDMPSIAATRGG
jgi:hypothetical protein